MAYFPITTILSLLLIFQFGPSQQALFSACITNYTVTVNNQTDLISDPYQTNLLTLFTNLTTSTSSFYNTTAGDSPDKAYGLYLCRGDATSDVCHTCVVSLTTSLSTTQSGCKESAAFMDDCMIRYANYSIFAKVDDTVIGTTVGKFEPSPSQEYNTTLKRVLQGAIADAASSATKYATLEGAVQGDLVYGLAQCTPDINSSGCTGCLNTARANLEGVEANITGGGVAKSAWAMLPSCQLRYDNATFYGSASPANANSAPSMAVVVTTLILFLVNWLI